MERDIVSAIQKFIITKRNKENILNLDYDVYIDRENDENYREYFKLAYEKMNRYDFPENQDIYTYHCIDENLGEIRSIYMAMRMNCMYFMSDDSGARSFVKNTFTSKMNYHSHEFRDEVWTVIAGEGRAVINDVEQNEQVGDVLTMKAGCKHTIIADTELQVIEVQIGDEIGVHDQRKFIIKLG